MRPIISSVDNGPCYSSKKFSELCRTWGVAIHHLLRLSPAGEWRRRARECADSRHSESYSWEPLLSVVVGPSRVQWHLNSAWHSVIRMSPYEALYAEPPRSAVSRIVGQSDSGLSVSELRERSLYLQLRAYLGTAVKQARWAAAANTGAVVPVYNPGDRVLLHRPYTAHKLASHWSGPHTIVKRLADNVYLVRDYVMGSEHATHVSRLHRFNMSRTTDEQIAAMNVD